MCRIKNEIKVKLKMNLSVWDKIINAWRDLRLFDQQDLKRIESNNMGLLQLCQSAGLCVCVCVCVCVCLQNVRFRW